MKFSRTPGTEASNIPNGIQVLNWGLIWSLHYSSDDQIIEMITEIKFAIINVLIHSWEERLTCFDCKQAQMLLLSTRRVGGGGVKTVPVSQINSPKCSNIKKLFSTLLLSFRSTGIHVHTMGIIHSLNAFTFTVVFFWVCSLISLRRLTSCDSDNWNIRWCYRNKMKIHAMLGWKSSQLNLEISTVLSQKQSSWLQWVYLSSGRLKKKSYIDEL